MLTTTVRFCCYPDINIWLAVAVCAFAGVARDEVERTLRSYDNSQIDLCEFFLAEVAAYALS